MLGWNVAGAEVRRPPPLLPETDCCEAARRLASWSALYPGDMESRLWNNLSKFSHYFEVEHTCVLLIWEGRDWDTGSRPILILLAFSASFSQARASICSASTLVRCGGVGLWTHSKIINLLVKKILQSYVVNVKSGLLSWSLGATTGFQICSDPLPWSLRVLGELTSARVDDGLDLLLGLLGDWNMTIQVLINKQSDKHLKQHYYKSDLAENGWRYHNAVVHGGKS